MFRVLRIPIRFTVRFEFLVLRVEDSFGYFRNLVRVISVGFGLVLLLEKKKSLQMIKTTLLRLKKGSWVKQKRTWAKQR